MWKTVETKAGKDRVVEAERGRSKRGGREETRGKNREKTEKAKKGKDNRSEEDS